VLTTANPPSHWTSVQCGRRCAASTANKQRIPCTSMLDQADLLTLVVCMSTCRVTSLKSTCWLASCSELQNRLCCCSAGATTNIVRDHFTCQMAVLQACASFHATGRTNPHTCHNPAVSNRATSALQLASSAVQLASCDAPHSSLSKLTTAVLCSPANTKFVRSKHP
jgi:hypothetical protein